MSSPVRCDISALAGSPIACSAVVFRQRGHLRVTAIVKATFALVPNGAMTVAPPSEIVVKERFSYRSPTASLQAASDLAPHRPRVDVTFVGHAHAPGGSAQMSSARLAVFRESALVDKTIHVYGDRTPATAGAPRPFDRMPIVYERAYAVLDCPSIVENPAGVAQPNIVDPRDAKRPVGFGPISRHWPSRKRLLGAVDGHALEAFFRAEAGPGAPQEPIAEIPEGFDWRYFQCAPPDQQIDVLRGDEWIVLDGLHPTSSRLASRLPSAVAVARVYGRNSASEPLLLVPDTLAIDGDRQSCDVVWRGSLAVAGGEAALSSLRIVAGLELPGRPVTWPQHAPDAARRRSAPVAGEATVIADRPQLAAAVARAVTPFDGKRDVPPSASPYARASARAARPLEESTGTIVASASSFFSSHAAQVLPFHGGAPGGPARPELQGAVASGREVAHDLNRTVLDDSPASFARAVTPFECKPASPASASPYARSAGPAMRGPSDLGGTVIASDGLRAFAAPATPFERRNGTPERGPSPPMPANVDVPIASRPEPPVWVAPPPEPPVWVAPPPEPPASVAPPPEPPVWVAPPPEPPAPFVPPPEPPAPVVSLPELPAPVVPPPEPPAPVEALPDPYAPSLEPPVPPAPPSPPPLSFERPAAGALKGGFYSKFGKKK